MPLYVQQNEMHHFKREREFYLTVNEMPRSTAYLLLKHGENLLCWKGGKSQSKQYHVQCVCLFVFK